MEPTPATWTRADLGRGAPRPAPPIADYLVRDYASFRRLILEHIRGRIPDWREDRIGDIGVALVEVLAYAADYLSYYQDAVGTEAYLSTARQRISIRRHSKLIDYPFSEGCNARTWVHLEVTGEAFELPRGTAFCSNKPASESATLDPPATPSDDSVFESMRREMLRPEHNRMPLCGQSDTESLLPKAATTGFLVGHYKNLRRGQVLVLENSPPGVAGTDPAQVHPILLTHDPESTVDSRGRPVTRLTWAVEDALPADFPLSVRLDSGGWARELTVARGNMVLSDHGRSVSQEFESVVQDVPYRPSLGEACLSFSEPLAERSFASAAGAVYQEPGRAVPQIDLEEYPTMWALHHGRCKTAEWHALPDLLLCDPSTRGFVVEVSSNGGSTLRFGDGKQGRRPQVDARFKAIYRTGNGVTGNVNSRTLTHLVNPDPRVLATYNPLPAIGGTDPEPLETARFFAPQAFWTQQRCVTSDDFAQRATRHPILGSRIRKGVARVEASRGGRRVSVFVDTFAPWPCCRAFCRALQSFLRPWAIIGDEVSVLPPESVDLEISLQVWIGPATSSHEVRSALEHLLSDQPGPGGIPGTFDPRRWDFGEAIHLSHILARVSSLHGVHAVEARTFRRLSGASPTEPVQPVILLQPHEMIRFRPPDGGESQWLLSYAIDRVNHE